MILNLRSGPISPFRFSHHEHSDEHSRTTYRNHNRIADVAHQGLTLIDKIQVCICKFLSGTPTQNNRVYICRPVINSNIMKVCSCN